MIVGATGTIGSAVCGAFVNRGYDVVAVARSSHKLQALRRQNQSLTSHCVNVINPDSCLNMMRKVKNLNGLIYSVGYCPPGGFGDSIAVTMTNTAASERLQREFEMQLYGLHNIICHSLPVFKQGSKIIVINSLITRLPRIFHPMAMHDAYYLAAKKAQETFLKRIRQNDPAIREKEIKISILYPGAISCEFHTNSNLLPPAFVPLDKVVSAVLKSYKFKKSKDAFILPSIFPLRRQG